MKNQILTLIVFLSAIMTGFSQDVGKDIDGTPEYRKSVTDSYRKLQYKMSVYEQVPKSGSGIRLGGFSRRKRRMGRVQLRRI